MAIIVTLDIFSGRPNPSWELSEDQSRELTEKIYSLEEKTLLKTPSIFYGLGYRGFIISSIGEKALPNPLVVNAGIIDLGWERESYFDSLHEIEKWLLETSANLLQENIKLLVKQEIGSDRNNILYYTNKNNLKFDRLIQPPYNPGWWNNDKKRLTNNNCYNYSCNKVTNTYAQPGLGTRSIYNSFTCEDISLAAVQDGLFPTSILGPNPDIGHYAALVVALNLDFHWYRRDNTDTWSHKPGRTPVINYDYDGQIISDPRNANRHIYKYFCGFYHILPEEIRIL